MHLWERGRGNHTRRNWHRGGGVGKIGKERVVNRIKMGFEERCLQSKSGVCFLSIVFRIYSSHPVLKKFLHQYKRYISLYFSLIICIFFHIEGRRKHCKVKSEISNANKNIKLSNVTLCF